MLSRKLRRLLAHELNQCDLCASAIWPTTALASTTAFRQVCNCQMSTRFGHNERQLCNIDLKQATGRCWPVSDLWLEGADWPVSDLWLEGADWPITAGRIHREAMPIPLAMLVRPAAGNGQFSCRPWSVSLATLVSCCGEGGQVAGVLQHPLKGDGPNRPTLGRRPAMLSRCHSNLGNAAQDERAQFEWFARQLDQCFINQRRVLRGYRGRLRSVLLGMPAID